MFPLIEQTFSNPSGLQKAALVGIPGIGKSQTAIQYARIVYAAECPNNLAWYIPAQNPRESLQNLLLALKTKKSHSKKNIYLSDKDLFTLVRRKLTIYNRGWLLVVDDANTPELEYLPETAFNGQVLFAAKGSTYSDQWGSSAINIKKLSIEDSLRLLRNIVNSSGAACQLDDLDTNVLLKICSKLQGLPLHVNAIAGRIRANVPLNEILKKLDGMVELKPWDSGHSNVYDSFEELFSSLGPEELHILGKSSFLASSLPTALVGCETGNLITRLLLEIEGKEHYFLHPSIQDCVRAYLSKRGEISVCLLESAKSLDRFMKSYSFEKYNTWIVAEQAVPHAHRLADHLKQNDGSIIYPPFVVHTLSQIAEFVNYARDDTKLAKQLARTAITIIKRWKDVLASAELTNAYLHAYEVYANIRRERGKALLNTWEVQKDILDKTIRGAAAGGADATDSRGYWIARARVTLAQLQRDEGMQSKNNNTKSSCYNNALSSARLAKDFFLKSGHEMDKSKALLLIAQLERNLNHLDDALAAAKESEAIMRSELPNEFDYNREIASVLYEKAWILLEKNQQSQAIPILKESLQILRRCVHADNTDITFIEYALARAYSKVGKKPKSIPLLQHVLEATLRQHGSEYHKVAIYNISMTLAENLRDINEDSSQYLKVAKDAAGSDEDLRKKYEEQLANWNRPQ